MIARVRYDDKRLPKCEICGKSFRRLGLHVYHSHNMTAKDYRILIGIDLKQSLSSKASSKKSHDAIMRNYDRCIVANIIERNDHKFTRGRRGKKYLSEQSKRRITEQIAHTWKRPISFDNALTKNISYLESIACKNKIYNEDAISDAIVEALRSWYRWNTSYSFISWIWGIYKNIHARINTSPYVAITQDIYKIPDVYIEADEDVIRVDLNKLTAHEKTFASLLSEGKKVREIAEILGNRPDSVKSYKAKLVKKLKEEYFLSFNREEDIRIAKKEWKNNGAETISTIDREKLTYQLN